MEIREEVLKHLTKLFDEIEEAIKLFPDDLWRREGVSDMLMVPAFLAHHTVWCMSLGHLLNIPKEKRPNDPGIRDYKRENLPEKSQLLALLDDIRAYTTSFYGKMENDVYLSGEKTSPIGRIMYTIAHTRHHFGQLVQILKENNIKPPRWYNAKG